jgi:hypothetical protein
LLDLVLFDLRIFAHIRPYSIIADHLLRRPRLSTVTSITGDSARAAELCVRVARHADHLARDLLRGLIVLLPLIFDVTMSAIHTERSAGSPLSSWMFFFSCSTRFSLLPAGSGSSEGSSAVSPGGAAGAAEAFVSPDAAVLGKGGAGIV